MSASRRGTGLRRLALVTVSLAATFGAAPVLAADDPDAAALDLQPTEPAQAPAAASAPTAPRSSAAKPAANPFKVVMEAAAGRARLGDGSSETLARASLDGRWQPRLDAPWSALASARVDALKPRDPLLGRTVFTLREASFGWRNGDGTLLLDGGRIALRNGPAYGFNPTDFFRTDALRTIITANPVTQREMRMGTFMLRGQKLTDTGSWTLAYAPKLDDGPSGDGWSLDEGATNPRHRLLASYSHRFSPATSGQVLLLKDGSDGWALGANGSMLLSDHLVVHGEWAWQRSADALAAMAPSLWDDGRRQGHRLAAGFTYTFDSKLSATLEAHHDGLALREGQLAQLAASGSGLLPAYLRHTQSSLDPAGRNSVLLYATQRDLGWRNFDVTGLVKVNVDDASRLAWLDLRYRFERMDLSLQFQHAGGGAATEFGLLPVRRSVGLVATFYAW